MSELANQYFEKSLAAVKRRDYEHATKLLVEAIKLKPDFYEAWVVRGNCCSALERPFDALLHYEKALGINDRLQDAHNNMGIAFSDIGLWASAEQAFRKSAELLPAMEPHMGLANMFCTLNRLEEAAAEYRLAIKHGEGLSEPHFNLGVTLLGMGQWKEGFQEYEWRWGNTAYPPRAYREYPKWKGEHLDGKRIVLYPEQGYGDEIMGLRFAHELCRRYPDAAIIVQARAPMLRLAGSLRGTSPAKHHMMVTSIHDDLGPITVDWSCPLLDVPGVLGLQPDTVPRPQQYLAPAAKHPLIDWQDRLRELPPGLNVGLCWWSGGHMGTSRAAQQAKSIPLHWLKPLAMPGVNLISLQKERPPGIEPFDVTDWTRDLHDFADTAALIEALDLVISVDTAVAHLAGALGKPVWNLVRFSGYWPWLSAQAAGNPERSIWYPSMKLVRQPSLANWVEPIERVMAALKEFAGSDRAVGKNCPPDGGSRIEPGARRSNGLPKEYLLVERLFPGDGLVIWALCDQDGKLILTSTESHALVVYAESIKRGRPIFVWDDDGPRQCGVVAA